MQISNRMKILTGAVAATIVLGAAGIGAAYAAGDGDGDNDGSSGQGTVQTPEETHPGFGWRNQPAGAASGRTPSWLGGL
jgi:hypothetical protein